MKSLDIIEVTRKVVEVFRALDIAYLIGGSLASSAFGIPRATLDVDLVAEIRPEHVTAIYKALMREFYVDANMINEAIKTRSSFNIIHLDTMYKVDIFIPKERPFDIQAFSRRVQKPFSENSSQELFFATPEDIILHKLEWYEAGSQVADRQWNDIIGVLKVQGNHLDRTYLKKWAEELRLSNLLKKAIAESKRF
jgi:hypothetical protein